MENKGRQSSCILNSQDKILDFIRDNSDRNILEDIESIEQFTYRHPLAHQQITTSYTGTYSHAN